MLELFIVVTCSSTPNVHHDIISAHAHQRASILTPFLRIYQCTKCDMRNLCKQNVTIVFLPICHLAQLSICGNSRYLLPKSWKWQICHTHKAFKVPVLTFSNNLWTFPPVKSIAIEFHATRTQQYSPVSHWWIPHVYFQGKGCNASIMWLTWR